MTLEELQLRIEIIEMKMKLDGSWYVNEKDKFFDRKYQEIKSELYQKQTELLDLKMEASK